MSTLKFNNSVMTPNIFLTEAFEGINWSKRDAVIQNEKGKTIFEQKDVIVPENWSQTALNIVASKYFHGKLGTPQRENSIKQLITRVVTTIAKWGFSDGYFKSSEEAKNFANKLAQVLVKQEASFNSPVWFNVGITDESRGYGWVYHKAAEEIVRYSPEGNNPQCSACFILSVEDTMESILDLVKTEGMLFKYGSGCGTNLSTLREEGAPLSHGGGSSGPLSFMKGFDAFAGVIKSGGKTRRAAKMIILNADHPDVEKFIWCKANEEKKAHALVAAGFDNSMDGEAYASIFFQNANNSVRVSNSFMQAAEDKALSYDSRGNEIDPAEILKQIAGATWQCGDPGMQFDTTINKFHTCKATSRINASNPCSEYMFLDDSACNLASINLIKFLNLDGTFDCERFKHTVEILITAQEILVDNASYPTKKIAQNSHDYRPLGLGYANLGALLMAKGIAYDSDEARALTGSITALMTGQAYYMSSRLATETDKGSFVGYEENKNSFMSVMYAHRYCASHSIKVTKDNFEIKAAAQEAWNNVICFGEAHGFRNAQVTVIAPTGTIGFMMDCDTTGIEPELALVKYKKLVGGGSVKLTNDTVWRSLLGLGYSSTEIGLIVEHIGLKGTIEGAPGLKSEHLPVFDCSFKPENGSRSIHHMGHIKMMAAVQPFISGAISKTINMPEDSTVEEIKTAYYESWKLGLKSVAIYRDNSKKVQPLNTSKTKSITDKVVGVLEIAPNVVRHKLPADRVSFTHKFVIGGHKGYFTVGLFEDGTPGEIFIKIAKEGSTISGLMDSFATSISYCLQYGVPLKFLTDKFAHVRFEPSGWTEHPEIRYANSIPDYIFRWLALRFPTLCSVSPQNEPLAVATERLQGSGKGYVPAKAVDAPVCHNCGNMMTPNGSCYKCENCGGTSGCS